MGRLDNIIYESVAKTVENMAFTEVLPTDFEMVETGNEYAVTISVLEPCKGYFTMRISRELLIFISESMLAKPGEEIKEENLFDFLSELLNTIAGSFLSAALPDDTKFSLGLPEIIGADKASATVQAMRWNFIAEEAIFSISASGELIEYLNDI